MPHPRRVSDMAGTSTPYQPGGPERRARITSHGSGQGSAATPEGKAGRPPVRLERTATPRSEPPESALPRQPRPAHPSQPSAPATNYRDALVADRGGVPRVLVAGPVQVSQSPGERRTGPGGRRAGRTGPPRRAPRRRCSQNGSRPGRARRSWRLRRDGTARRSRPLRPATGGRPWSRSLVVHAADHASSGRPSSLAGTRSSADTESSASPGLGSPTEGIEAWRPVPGRLAVQRWVHDLTSLQYQRMSAQACPPSGTISSSGNTMPHSEHWVDCDRRGRSLRGLAIGAPRAREMLVHRNSATSSGTPAVWTAVADRAYAPLRPQFLPANRIIKVLGAVPTRCYNGNHSGLDNSGKPVKFSVPPEEY